MNAGDFKRHLRENGCILAREGKSHEIWLNQSNNKSSAVPRHREIKTATSRAICKALEIPIPKQK